MIQDSIWFRIQSEVDESDALATVCTIFWKTYASGRRRR